MNTEALRLLRVYHDMTQTALADRLGVSKGHLSGIESGKKNPTLQLLQKYAEVFDLPVSSLLLLMERSSESRSASLKTLISEKAINILAWLAEVSEADAERRG